MNIGKEVKEYEFEPVSPAVPVVQPVPVEPVPDREPVPVGAPRE